MRLDHLSSVGPPYFVNQVVQPHLSGPTEYKWSKRTQVVQAEERRREPTGPFSPGVVVRDRGRRGAVRAGAVRGGGGAGRSCARREVHSALEMCILHSKGAVRSARSSAKCTPRHPGVGAGPVQERSDRRGRRPCRGPRRRRLSESVAKTPIEPGRARRIVDIPRFCSPPIPPRDAFATDSDTTPPRTAPGAPPAPPRARPAPSPRRSRPVRGSFW